jgi:hypothetical protein
MHHPAPKEAKPIALKSSCFTATLWTWFMGADDLF